MIYPHHKIYHVRAGWRNWSFLFLAFSPDIYGWSEFTASNSSVNSISTCINDICSNLSQNSYTSIQSFINHLRLVSRQSLGGPTTKAISAVENALWDAKARSLSTNVINLFGGQYSPIRTYWSHFVTTRVRASQHVGAKPINSFDDLSSIFQEASELNVDVVKTNIFLPHLNPQVHMPGFGRCDSLVNPNILGLTNVNGFKDYINAFETLLPSSISYAIDLNYNLSLLDFRSLSPFLNSQRLAWVEFDHESLEFMRSVRTIINASLSSAENIDNLPKLNEISESSLVDYMGIDVQWTGLYSSLCAAKCAEHYGVMINPHNFNSHLSTFISSSFASCLNNIGYLEYDYDDVPWRDDLVSTIPNIQNGLLHHDSSSIGWGVDLIPDMLIKYKS